MLRGNSTPNHKLVNVLGAISSTTDYTSDKIGHHIAVKNAHFFLPDITGRQGFFSKFLMGGGTQNFRSPSVPDGDEVGWGGGTCEKNPTEAKTAH